MIIIKIDDERKLPMDIIVKMMINLEKGSQMYNVDGKLVNDHGLFHYLKHAGVTYEFRSNRFSLYCKESIWSRVKENIKRIISIYDRKEGAPYSISHDMEIIETLTEQNRYYSRTKCTNKPADIYWNYVNINKIMNY